MNTKRDNAQLGPSFYSLMSADPPNLSMPHSIDEHPNSVRKCRKSKGLTLESINRNAGLYNSPALPTQNVSLHSIEEHQNQHHELIPIRICIKSKDLPTQNESPDMSLYNSLDLPTQNVSPNMSLYNSLDLPTQNVSPHVSLYNSLDLPTQNVSPHVSLYNSLDLPTQNVSPHVSLYNSLDLPTQNVSPHVSLYNSLDLPIQNVSPDMSLYNSLDLPTQNVSPNMSLYNSLDLSTQNVSPNMSLYNSLDLPTQNVSLHSDMNSYIHTLPITEGLSLNKTNLSTSSLPNEGAQSWVIMSKAELLTIKGTVITPLENPKPAIMSSLQPIEENIPPTIPASFSELVDSSWMECNFTQLLMETEDFSLDSIPWSNPGIFTETAKDESAMMEFQPVYNINSPPVSEANAISSGTNSLQFAVAIPDDMKQIENRQHLSTDENSSQEKEFVALAENVNVIVISEAEAANVSAEVIIDKNGLQQQEEGKGVMDLNKTPKLKTPKKRKHRPKVVIEGKAKRNPKAAKGLKKTTTSPDEQKKCMGKRNRVEMENGSTNSKEKKMNSKRKYARKNKEPIVEHQPETSTKSCRKTLEFDLEIEQGLEGIQSEAGNEAVETEQHNAITRSFEMGQSDQTREQNNHVSSQVTAAQENLFHGITQTDENSKILEGYPLLLTKKDSNDNLVTGPEFLKKMRTGNGFLQMEASTTFNSPPTVPRHVSTSDRNFNMLSSPNLLISRVDDTFTSNSVDLSSHSEVAKQNTIQPQSLALFPLNVEKSQSSDYLGNILGMPNTDQPSSSQNRKALPVGYHQKGKKSNLEASQEKHLEEGTPSKLVVTVKDKMIPRQKKKKLKQKHGLNCTPTVSINGKAGLKQKEKENIITVDQLISRLKDLSIIDYSGTGKMTLVTYKGDGTVVPYGGNDKPKRVTVDLDPETDRVWKLLMGGSEFNEAEDKVSEEWWDEQRKIFHGRVESFIARMHLIQGDRRFSRWKGSVVDSVVGVFLTQNVSDHLSSSAFISLVAKYPPHKESVSEKAPIIEENLFTDVSEKVSERPSNSYDKQVEEDFGSSDNPNCYLQVHDEVISWVEPNSKPETSMNHLNCPSSSTHLHTNQMTTLGERRDQLQPFHWSADQYIRTNDATEARRQFSLLDKYDDAKYLSTGTFSKTDFYASNEIVPTTPEKATGSFYVSPIWSEVSNSNMNHSSKSIGDKAKDLIRTIINRKTTLSEAPRNGSSAALNKNPIQEQFFPISSHYISKYTNSADTNNQEKLSSLQQQIEFNSVPLRHEQISGKSQIGGRQQVPIIRNESIFLSDELPKLDNGGRLQVPISPNKRIFLSGEMLKLDNGSRQQVPISPNKKIFLSDEMPKLDTGNRQPVPISPNKRKILTGEMPKLDNEGRQQVPISPNKRIFLSNEIPKLDNGGRQTISPDKKISEADGGLKLDNGAVGINTKERVHSFGESNNGTAEKISRKKKAKTGNEKPKPDWDSLRRQVEANGKRKERCSDTMDSLDYDAIRKASIREVSNTIRERGMNNMLAERIKEFLDRIVEEHGAVDLEWLRDVPPDKTKDFLMSIRGLGLKSVECVRLLTLHHLAFPVDTNVGRIAVRLGWVPLRPLPESLQLHLLEQYPILESIQKYLWPRLCKLDQRTLYELHYQMITFGKVFCTKTKPNCNACPLKGECRHFASAFASARLALPGPEEGGRTVTTSVPTPVKIIPLQLPSANNSILPKDSASIIRSCEPIVEEPASPPEPQRVEMTQSDIEDYEDPETIPTCKLNLEEFTWNLQSYIQESDFSKAFTHNLQSYMQENMELQESGFSKALVALNPETASIPAAKLKNVSRLRTEHQVYELPDSHPLLNEMERREPNDPSPYLLAIWAPGETADSTQLPARNCGSQDTGNLCNENTCSTCNNIREANAEIVRGTLLIPCRTAMKGFFPLNGTYFQVNEMFADHESSLNPINVPRSLLWNLRRSTVCFGASVTSIFKGLSTEEIQKIFWKGFLCVRGFDQKARVPRPLVARLHLRENKKNDKEKKVNPD